MAPENLEEHLVKYLSDAHSIEHQALVQMKAAPKLAGDEQIARLFDDHRLETEGHERTVAELLERRGAHPSKLKDAVGMLTGAGFGAFAAAQPDTPGKLVAHAFSYEHMEEAAYHLIGALAQRAGDSEVAAAALEIERQERGMAERLEGAFDLAASAALDQQGPDDLERLLGSYLTDAHAIEAQSVQLLQRSPQLAGVPSLATAYEQHLAESVEHLRTLESQLEQRGAGPSKLKDAALRLGALNWGLFFQAQPDTPAKLAAFSYAFEHLEIAAYELLARVAARAGDAELQGLIAAILQDERAAAETIWNLLDEALTASLQDQDALSR